MFPTKSREANVALEYACLACDSFSSGVVVTDARSHALWANRRAREFASREGGIAFTSSRIVALIFIVEPYAAGELDRHALRDLYGLSRCEAETAALIAQGKSVAEAALIMNVSVNTSRAHLKWVFTKTRTTWRSDLVLRLAGSVAALRLQNSFG